MELNYPWMKQGSMTKTHRHFFIGLILLTIGLALASMPNRYEGPSLLHLSKGHGVSVSDVVALLPLIGGAVFVWQGLWPSRQQFREKARLWLQTGGVEIFLAGIAAGMIVERLAIGLRWGRLSLWLIIAAVLGLRWWLIQRRASSQG